MANDHESLSSPKGGAFSITPNDSADLAIGATAIYIGSDGNITVDTSFGDTVAFVGVLSGTVLPVRARRVYSTGTTASNLVGLY